MLYNLVLKVLETLKNLIALANASAMRERMILAKLDYIEAITKQILEQVIPAPAVTLNLTAEIDGQIFTGVAKMTDTQQTALAINPRDKKDNPAVLDGLPQWLSSNTEILNPVASADGLSCQVKAVGPLGTATITVKADADLGEGVRTIQDSIEITVTGGEATGLGLTAGAVTEQDDAPPAPVATPQA